MEVGGVLSAAPQRQVRAAARRRTARDSRGAWRHRHVVRLRRSRTRRPARLPRARQARQRLRRRADRERPASAVAHRPFDAQDAADLAVPRAAWAILRRTRALAEQAGIDGRMDGTAYPPNPASALSN